MRCYICDTEIRDEIDICGACLRASRQGWGWNADNPLWRTNDRPPSEYPYPRQAGGTRKKLTAKVMSAIRSNIAGALQKGRIEYENLPD